MTNRGRILAGWQRKLLWGMWLAILGLLMVDSDSGSFSGVEFLALLAGFAVTIGICQHPQGQPKTFILQSNEMRGEFASRSNWALVLVAAGLTLFGLAMSVKLTQDLSSGRATWKDVFEDVIFYFIEWLIEKLSGGTSGDVTHTRLYIMVVLLPLGLSMLWFTLVLLVNRGHPFRVNDDGALQWQSKGEWQTLEGRDYAMAVADGLNVSLFTTPDAGPAIVLPLSRVYAKSLGTRVRTNVLAKFFRDYFESRGFTVKRRTPEGMVEQSWIALRQERLTQDGAERPAASSTEKIPQRRQCGNPH